MIKRNELEKLYSANEVWDIISECDEMSSNIDWGNRVGVIKTMLEEYYPLYLCLKFCFPNDAKARLTEESNPGPDDVIKLNDCEYTIQITCSDEDYNSALQRECLNNKEVVFPNMQYRRGDNKKINASGNFFSTKEAKAGNVIDNVKKVIGNKIEKYRSNTDILLVSTNVSEITMPKNWKSQIQMAVSSYLSSFEHVPYDKIYVTHNDLCFLCWQQN